MVNSLLYTIKNAAAQDEKQEAVIKTIINYSNVHKILMTKCSDHSYKKTERQTFTWS